MAAPTFIDRVRELSALEGFWQAPGAQLVVLYGRRRVGKTELLRRFCLGKRHVHFQAAVASPIDNLRHFLGQAAEGTGDAVPALAAFADWESSLRYLAQRSGQERLVVVLDEFPYLCEGDPALPSLLQRFWDEHGSRSSLMLVLCGS